MIIEAATLGRIPPGNPFTRFDPRESRAERLASVTSGDAADESQEENPLPRGTDSAAPGEADGALLGRAGDDDASGETDEEEEDDPRAAIRQHHDEQTDAERVRDEVLEVRIRVSKLSSDPERTIAEMAALRRAALTPSEPSTTDYRIATEASREIASARRDLEQTDDETPDDESRDRKSDADPAAAAVSGHHRTDRRRSEYARAESPVPEAGRLDRTR